MKDNRNTSQKDTLGMFSLNFFISLVLTISSHKPHDILGLQKSMGPLKNLHLSEGSEKVFLMDFDTPQHIVPSRSMLSGTAVHVPHTLGLFYTHINGFP